MIALGIESSSTRGMGHLFRSLLYVDYLRSRKVDFIYLINDDIKSIKVLKQHNIEYQVVNYDDVETDWEKNIIEQYDVDIWINDKFETKTELVNHVKSEGVYFALIDDIGEGEFLADIHFVGLVYFTKSNFSLANTFHGMEYVILNKEVKDYRRVRKNTDRIIVSLGGSDPFSTAVTVVEELMKNNYSFDILIGPNSKCKDDLVEMNDGRFRLFQDVPSAIELFSNYDFAITGGGVTCCEVCAMGIPCIVIANAPHEVNTGKYLQKLGCSMYAGEHNNWDRSVIGKIRNLNVEKMSKIGIASFKVDAVDRIFQAIFKDYNNRMQFHHR